MKREDSELQRQGQEPQSFHTAPAVDGNNGEGKEIFTLPAFPPISPQQMRHLETNTILDITVSSQHFPENIFHSDIRGFFQLKSNQIKTQMV